MARHKVITLPGGAIARSYAIKCNRRGCRRVKRGYLTVQRSNLGGGAFYDKRGTLLADLRQVDFLCKEHGIVDGSAPFLYPDAD